MTVTFLLTSFLSFTLPCVVWVIGAHSGCSIKTRDLCSRCGSGERTVSLLGTRDEAASARLCCVSFLPWSPLQLTMAETCLLVFRLRLYLIQTCFPCCVSAASPTLESRSVFVSCKTRMVAAPPWVVLFGPVATPSLPPVPWCPWHKENEFCWSICILVGESLGGGSLF